MQLTALSLALTRAGLLTGFSPISLFSAGEPGVWYDPSDLTTMYQDAAGTTPVTAVEQPVGLLLDKSRGLVLGPELVTGDSSNFSGGTVGSWATSGFFPATISVASGELEIAGTGALKRAVLSVGGLTAGKTYVAQCIGRRNSASSALVFGIALDAGGSIGSVAATTSSTVNALLRFQFIASGASQFIAAGSNNSGVAGDTFYIDNISVRELPGAHASQSTATSRPVLSARVNLLTKTEQFDDAGWVKESVSVAANDAIAPNGSMTADKVIEAATTNTHAVRQTLVLPDSPKLEIRVKPAGRTWIAISITSTRFVYFNLSGGGAIGTSLNATGAISVDADGWYTCSITASGTAGAETAYIYLASANGTASYTGDGTSGIYIWGASLVPANQSALPYQRVNTATDYDTVGFPTYLKFDGIDDSLVTPTITPGTDKAQIFAGVRKLSDAAGYGMIAENSTGVGSFSLAAPADNGTGTYYCTVSGTTRTSYIMAAYSAPHSAVISVAMDIAGAARANELFPRVNGAIPTLTGADSANAGTGNFGNYPLYIGRRNNASLPFNGHLYPLIVRFGPTLTEAQITQTETWVNGKTGAF